MIGAYLMLGVVLIGVLTWGRRDALRFLEAHSSITDWPALDRFKALAKRNMIATLILLPLGGIWLLWSVYLAITLSLVGAALVTVVNVPMFLLSNSLKTLEVKARSLDCPTDAIRQEQRRVAETWVKKVLPDF